MKRTFLLWILLAGGGFICGAQVTFQKTFGEEIYYDLGIGTCLVSDGGCIVIGRSNNFNGNGIYAIRLDSTGNMKWARTYSSYLNLNAVKSTNDDGFIICGTTDDLNICLLRCDSAGDTLWTRTFINIDEFIAIDIAVRDDGDFIVYGENSINENELIVFQLTASGNLLWSRILTFPWIIGERQIEINPDSGILISGNLGDTAFIVTKLSSGGSFLWSKEYHSPENPKNSALKVTSDGDYMLSGYLDNSDYPKPFYILSLDPIGNPIWCKLYGGLQENFLSSIIKTEEGNFLGAGVQSDSTGLVGDILVFCFDENGDTVFTNVFGRTGYYEWSQSVCETQDGGFYLSGSEFFPTNWEYDIYLAKTDDRGRTGCLDRTSGIFSLGPLSLQVSSIVPSIIASTMTAAFTPLVIGSGVSETIICSSIGVQELNAKPVLNIFPNPSKGAFHIFFSEINPYKKLIIFNALGEIILQNDLRGEETLEINLSDQVPGIYLVRLENENHFQTARICLTD